MRPDHDETTSPDNIKTENVSLERIKEERIAKYKIYKDRIQKAIQDGKVFRIITTMDITKIRLELKARGYIEAVPYTWNNKYFAMSNRELLEMAEDGNQYEQVLLSKMIDGFLPDYLWVTQPRLYDIHKSVPFINKISIMDFVDWGFKDGLHKCMQYVKKVEPEVVRDHYSRSFIMTGGEDLMKFKRDYRLTVAISLLKLIMTLQPNPRELFSTDYGKVKSKTIDIAIDIINKEIHALTAPKKKIVRFSDDDDLSEARWDQLKRGHILLLKRKGRIYEQKEEFIDHFLFRTKVTLDEVEKNWPEKKYDGYHNMWLVKPTYLGEGSGIVISDNDSHIIDLINLKKNAKYIVQKYIERPMLIHNTKFDIRQYFVVQIDGESLNVWSSPMSSIKFASVEFNKRCFHESIHITNTAIQMKYKTRSQHQLPADHLWTVHDFTNYLDIYVQRHLWKDVIYPQMKKMIVGLVKGSSHYIEKKSGRFELFGCDWLLTDDYKPILLEVNRPPSLEYYSPVSGIVCGTIMEDLVRVTVDKVRSPYAYTGSFELIYQEEVIPPRTSTPIPKDDCSECYDEETIKKRKLSLLEATPIKLET